MTPTTHTSIQQILQTCDWKEACEAIANEHKLSQKEHDTLERIIEDVLLFTRPASYFVDDVRDALVVSQETALAIAHKTERLIVAPFIEALEKSGITPSSAPHPEELHEEATETEEHLSVLFDHHT